MPQENPTVDQANANQTTDLRPLPGAWFTVMLLWVVGCLNYLDRVMITTMRESIKSAIPMGDDDFGMLMTVFLFVYGPLSPIGGWLADRFSRSRVITFSLCVWSLVTWGTAYATTYPQLLATRVLMGISEACFIPAALALIADYHRGTTRSLATGINLSGVYAGMALGGMGGWMADHYKWSTGFWFFGCVGVVFTVVLLLFLRDAPVARAAEGAKPASVDPLAAVRVLGTNRNVWIIAAYWCLLGFAGWAFLTWMPTFLRDRYHLSQGEAGFTATAYFQLAALAGVLAGGAWADRWSRTQLRGRVWVPMIGLILASPFVFLCSYTSVLWFAVVCLVAFGFARGCSDANTMPILCQVTEPQYRATGYGFLNTFSCCIGGLAAYLGGWLKEQHVDLRYLLMGSGVCVLLCGLLLAFVRPTRRS